MKNSETITKINPYSSKRVLVFGASLSANSINQVFAEYAASRLQGVQTTLIKFSDYANNLPIFTPEEL
jgi:NAD(P)H-dependent FMN reductase